MISQVFYKTCFNKVTTKSAPVTLYLKVYLNSNEQTFKVYFNRHPIVYSDKQQSLISVTDFPTWSYETHTVTFQLSAEHNKHEC